MSDIADILQCPVTGRSLSWLRAADLESLRQQMDAGQVRHLNGDQARLTLEAALGTADGRVYYPLVDGILILMPTLAMTLADYASDLAVEAMAPDTESVRKFYDEIGWNGDQEGGFEDARRWEDMRPVSADYIRKCHLRVNRFLGPRGCYLLDIASGPVQYDEYLTYSETYERRICADISIAALRAARRRMGDKGIYIQCDITQLPFRDDTLDGFVSLHTVYHVPAARQVLAFRELERVLMPGRSGVVVYSWGEHCRLMRVLSEFSWKDLVKRCIPKCVLELLRGSRHPVNEGSKRRTSSPALFFHPNDQAWFAREVAGDRPWEVRTWRSANVPFLQRHSGALGKWRLACLYLLEEAFPHILGRFGQYPLLVYRKPGT